MFIFYVVSPDISISPRTAYVFASFSEIWFSNWEHSTWFKNLNIIENHLLLNSRTLVEVKVGSIKIAPSLINAKKMIRF